MHLFLHHMMHLCFDEYIFRVGTTTNFQFRPLCAYGLDAYLYSDNLKLPSQACCNLNEHAIDNFD
jgi:hypothetical protein